MLKLPDLKGQTIVVNTFGGNVAASLQKLVVAPFEAATGAKVVVTTSCCEAFETQVKSNQFAGDVVLGADFGTLRAWGREGLLKSDPRLAQIATARGIDPSFIEDNIIQSSSYGYGLAWNTKEAGHHASWTDFFDTSKYRGSRGLPSTPTGALEMAALGTGTPASSVYPINTDKALAALSTLRKDSSINFWKSGAELQNKLGTGEIAYGIAYSSRVAAGVKQGLPIDMTLDQALLIASGDAIPATAKNVDGAIALIDFAMQPKVQAMGSNESGTTPSVPAALAMIDPAMQKYMTTNPDYAGKLIKLDDDFWMKNSSSLNQSYTAWVSGS